MDSPAKTFVRAMSFSVQHLLFGSPSKKHEQEIECELMGRHEISMESAEDGWEMVTRNDPMVVAE
jgi:hypothetical protein